jgi:8-oxo-dGTP pyrophosphatase MutT (NUDIX family)
MSPEGLPYRACAGFMLVNAEGLVFVGQRIDPSAQGFWQMPQGGIDKGEDVQAAALRELHEETGVAENLVEIIAQGAQPFLYDLPPEEAAQVPTVCGSLDMALAALDSDRAFLTAGGVFDDDMIDAYIALKQEEIDRLRMTTHPVEFDMYYSC